MKFDEGFHKMLELVRQIFAGIVTSKNTYGYIKVCFLLIKKILKCVFISLKKD